jgi:hypothetical protein
MHSSASNDDPASEPPDTSASRATPPPVRSASRLFTSSPASTSPAARQGSIALQPSLNPSSTDSPTTVTSAHPDADFFLEATSTSFCRLWTSYGLSCVFLNIRNNIIRFFKPSSTEPYRLARSNAPPAKSCSISLQFSTPPHHHHLLLLPLSEKRRSISQSPSKRSSSSPRPPFALSSPDVSVLPSRPTNRLHRPLSVFFCLYLSPSLVLLFFLFFSFYDEFEHGRHSIQVKIG